MQKLTLADAKARLHIPELWWICGLPGEPRKICCCPFHQDRTPSFSITPDGARWKCFAGCGGGDAVDFLQQARGLSRREACQEFLRLAGGGFVSAPPVNYIRPSEQTVPRKIELAGLTPGDDSQRRMLASLRNVSPDAIALAVRRGLLSFGN